MGTSKLWMVRAGKGAKFVDDFVEGAFVAVGWTDAGAIDENTSKKAIETRLIEARPGAGKGSVAVWAAQLKRYFSEVHIGDGVTTYDPSQRIYYLGEVTSAVQKPDPEVGHRRAVKWSRKVARDSLSTAARNSLGSISTLFQVPPGVAKEMFEKSVLLGEEIVETIPSEAVTDRELLDEVVNKAKEFVEDRIALLDWEEMQELVAGILEAMGYRCRVSDKGADRGVDIFASPDGLGLEEPRIFVEVKHRRTSAMGTQQLRAFLGGRRQGDRCLYVSTGGFTREARYEAERSTVPVTLITLPELRELLVEHYDELENSIAAMVPLERIYWPVT